MLIANVQQQTPKTSKFAAINLINYYHKLDNKLHLLLIPLSEIRMASYFAASYGLTILLTLPFGPTI